MKKCLFINPNFNSWSLVKFFLDKGIECHALIEVNDLRKRYGQNIFDDQTSDFPYHYFSKFYTSIRNMERFNEIKKLKYEAVVPSGDRSVRMAEALSEKFFCKGNDPNTSDFRVNKSVMYSALEKEGIDQIPFFSIKSSKAYWTKIKPLLKEGEYVLKPTDGSGNDGVVYCKNLLQLDSSVKKIAWGEVSFSASNTSFVIQEFYDGILFSIDLLFKENQYVVTSCCYEINDYQMTNRKDRYSALDQKYSIPLDTNHPYVKMIEPLAFKVSKILGIQYGPSHLEFLLYRGKLFFIDMGARLHGSCRPVLFQRCYENDLLENYYDLLFEEGNNLKSGRTKFKSIWSTIFYEETEPKNFPDLNKHKRELNQLRTLIKVMPVLKDGQKYTRKNKLCYGFFLSENPEDLISEVAIYEEIMSTIFNTKTYSIKVLRNVLEKIFDIKIKFSDKGD